MMTGNVSAMIEADGDLVISGDGANNAVDVRFLDTYKYEVRGLAYDGVTTINGMNRAVFNNVTGGIQIYGGGGNDYLRLYGTTDDPFRNGNSVFMFGGDGKDTIVAQNARIGRDLHIETGHAHDSVFVSKSWILEELNISCGDDYVGDYVKVYSSTRVGYTAHEGVLWVYGSYGGDQVYLEHVTTNHLYVLLYDGADYASIKYTTVLTDSYLHGGNDTSPVDAINRYHNHGSVKAYQFEYKYANADY